MLGQLDDLKQSKVYISLQKRHQVDRDPEAQKYLSRIGSAFESLHKYLAEVRRYFSHFTDHSITHSIRIVNRIGNFLSDDQLGKLTSTELYLLIACPLMHDIGMVVGENEVDELLANNQFRKQSENFRQSNNIEKNDDWERNGIGRLFIADFVRRHHGLRARKFALSDVLPVTLLTAGSESTKFWIGKICESHTLPFSNIAEESCFPTRLLLDERRVNTRFVALCLRLGDLLDINTNRVCPMLRSLSEPLHFTSAAHWDQYSKIQILETTPGNDVIVSGVCPTQESHRVLKQWLSWLEQELADSMQLLNTSASNQQHYRLFLGALKDEVEPEKDKNGNPKYEFLEYRFNLDEQKVFERLFGERLYGRTDVAFRELLQNAIDATRIRVALECSKNHSWNEMLPNEKREFFDQTYETKRHDFPLKVEFEPKVDPMTGHQSFWLHIEDQGVGMSREVISDYLLKVGRSRWREDQRVKHLQTGTVGEFGVGFLSTFMISDKTIIQTQSCLPDENGIEATVYNWDGYLSTRPLNSERCGTRVSMLLKPQFAGELCSLENILSKWCPHIELPVKLVGENGNEIIVEPTKNGPAGSHDGLTQLFLHKSKSTVCVDSVSKLRDGSNFTSVCQDGIAVPEIPPPLLEIPEQQILRWRRIRINLIGYDRIELDLSRNLMKGGHEKLWDELSKKIWGGLATNGLSFRDCRSMLAEYLSAEFVRKKGKLVMLVGPNDRFAMADPEVDPASSDLNFGELEDRTLGDWCPIESVCTCLLPNFSSLFVDEKLQISTAWLVDNEQYYYSSFDSYEYEKDIQSFEQEYIHQATQAKDEFLESQAIEEEFKQQYATSPFQDDATGDYWASKVALTEFPSTVASKDAISTLIRHYPKLQCLNAKYGTLTKTNGTDLVGIGAFRVSENWWVIRDVVDGVWTPVFAPEINFVLDNGRENSFAYADYILFILFRVWPPNNHHEWGKGWPLSDLMIRLGEHMTEIVEGNEGRNPYTPNYEDEKAFEEYELRVNDIGLEEIQKLSDEWERDVYKSIFLEKIEGKVDTSKLQAMLPSWDVEFWNTK